MCSDNFGVLVPFKNTEIVFFLKKIYLFHVWIHCGCLQTPQKRVSLQMVVSHHVVAGIEEQSVLLTAEPSLQPHAFLF